VANKETPDQVIQALDIAFNAGDLETILQYYEPEALVLPEPGTEARGLDAISALYGRFIQPGLSVEQERTHIMIADGISLFTSRWTLRTSDGGQQSFVSNVVLREQADGNWKVLIDNARGPQVLD